mmetsp:Transcript_64076/g.119103  ORF Transcript_64076/g.119103 Transcript_64076/m.119103 type:complete len:101 (+) Transcript_64076:306-608(+)
MAAPTSALHNKLQVIQPPSLDIPCAYASSQHPCSKQQSCRIPDMLQLALAVSQYTALIMITVPPHAQACLPRHEANPEDVQLLHMWFNKAPKAFLENRFR